MAAPTKQSRWGSFLSQAVAGVEARLDNILAENDDKEQKPATVPAAVSPTKPSPGPSRTTSNARPNDRLQERLARAVAARSTTPTGSRPDRPSSKGSGSAQDSPRQSVDVASRTSTDSSAPPVQGVQEGATLRTSQDDSPRSQDVAAHDVALAEESAMDKSECDGPGIKPNGLRKSLDEAPPSDPPLGQPNFNPATDNSNATAPPFTVLDLGEESRVKQLEKLLEEAQIQYQEETHAYIEQIDALQAKLQYLSRETTDAARKTIQAAPAGSVEKKLAEKDQQIAQLMEEGKNLASTEQKHRTIMKKLRARVAELEKESNDLSSSSSKLETELESQRRRARRADDLEKARDELQKLFDQAQKELSTLRSECSSKDGVISELKTQLQKASEQAETLTAKINGEAREQDRRRIAELEESVAALQVERNLVADRARLQANELKEKVERANERSRALELEMKAEMQITESKLEAMRIRAEEASSGAIGDSQAKLLRQVETLQTQYSIASDNWQGIEATLLARISSLEKERDEAQQRESEMRKKAREAAVRAKRNEEELEEAKTKLPGFQEDVKSYQTQLDSFRKRAEEAEARLREARAELEKQKQLWREERNDRPDPREHRGWLEDLPNAPFRSQSRPESPGLAAPQRTLSSDLLGLQSLSGKIRKQSAPSSNSDAGAGDRPANRRPSAQPPHRPSLPSAISGLPPTSSAFSPTYDALATPASHPMERDDVFEGIEMSSSPQQVMQDMVSVSTVAAGPSVQLVERMSAAIRRLESEKVAAREELARISNQRDEARAEIVSLMREVESGKAATNRVANLEAEVADINSRYQTTLEMLGEKSELVEELRADVEDVKAMYRDLVERTIR